MFGKFLNIVAEYTGIKILTKFIGILAIVGLVGFLVIHLSGISLNPFSGILSGTSGKQVDRAELVKQIAEFKGDFYEDTINATAHQEFPQNINLGSVHAPIPQWLVGQSLDASGQVKVYGGVDLHGIKESDVAVTRNGKKTLVTIHVPAPQITHVDIDPKSLQISSHAGFVTAITGAGQEKDLIPIATELVNNNAVGLAMAQDILGQTQKTAEGYIKQFLDTTAAQGGNVEYRIIVASPKKGEEGKTN